MKRLLTLILTVILAQAISAQQRIDSSFAFGSNPAKKYSVYLPSSYSPSGANALMVAFHPYDTSRWNASSWCDTLLAFGEANDLILLCPDGDSDGSITDSLDYAFTLSLMDSARKWYNIDTERIYAIGFSMGGKAVYEFGLEHADLFSGFIPIGPAISGSSFVSSTIFRAARKPFYLVHGANDFPSFGFYPMITALNSNCAYVDSVLLPGVGHTIDFPNRNTILGKAYQWVDSVNLSPKSGSISLVSPISFSTIEFKGFHDFIHELKWKKSSLQDSCGALTYEVLFDYPSGGFANPILRVPADNGGTDTTLSFTNGTADSALASIGIPLNTPTTLVWTVRSILLNKHSDTAKAFYIVFTRKNLGFNLVSPSNNNAVTLQEGQNKLFDWSDLNHYISVKYKLEMDDTGSTFINPLLSSLSPNNGVNSNFNISHEALYYGLMFDSNLAIGDSMFLQWTVSAEDTLYKEYASSTRNIWLYRGNIGFSLIFPQNNVLIQSKKGSNYTFTWDSVPRDDVTYQWLFDTLGVDLKDTAGVVRSSNNSGMNHSFTATFEFLDSLMDAYGVAYLDTLDAQWTSRALKNGNTEYSLQTYQIKIYRAHPVGLNELSKTSGIRLYPNPVSDQLHVEVAGGSLLKNLEILDMSGRLVFRNNNLINNANLVLDVSDLDEGQYVLRLVMEGEIQVSQFSVVH